MPNLKSIGILGGMGPQATVLLQQRLINAVKTDDDDGHVPLLIDMNPQVPSRLDFILKGEGQNPGVVLADMAKRLEGAGAKALAMPCNTAHHFAEEISDAVKIPFLHMVDSAAKILVEKFGAGKVGILASPATDDINLFKKYFEPHGLEPIFSPNRDEMVASIRRIKADGVSDADIETLEAAAMACEAQGAQSLLIGCSEFSLLMGKIKSQLPIIDTVDVLVNDIVEFSMGKKLD